MELEEVYTNIEDIDYPAVDKIQTDKDHGLCENGADSNHYSSVIKPVVKCYFIEHSRDIIKWTLFVCAFLILAGVSFFRVTSTSNMERKLDSNQQMLQTFQTEIDSNQQLIENNHKLLINLFKEISKDNNHETTTLPDTHNEAELTHGNCPRSNDASSHNITILPSNITVLCDTVTDGGGWIIFQRRVTGDVNFYRGWSEYVEGFGNLAGDFWLGLENLHTLCPPEVDCELRVDMGYEGRPASYYIEPTTTARYFAKYRHFDIAGLNTNYVLNVSMYSGNAGDMLVKHTGMGFTTLDNDNDKRSDANCAVEREGAWWYNRCYIFGESNLNGILNMTERDNHWMKFANWDSLTDYENSVTLSEMKVRPR